MGSIKERIEELRELIRKYDAAYYGRGNRSFRSEYDALYGELVKLEKENPEFFSPDSPTMRVGSDLTKNFLRFATVFP